MEARRKYLFVVNPIAGGLDKSDIISEVENYADREGIELVFFETTGERDKDAILELFEEHSPDRVLVTGGDGTVKLVADALEKHDVILGIVPGGSANGLSVDLDIPKTLEDIIKVAFNNGFQEIDMVDINGHRSLHLSDIGLNAELIKNYESSAVRGKLGYALQAINTLTDDEIVFKATVEANGEIIETEAKMIVIANSKKYGTGVTINPVGEIDDGKFEIVIIRDLNLVVFGKIVTGNMPLDSPAIKLISTDVATIRTNVPVHFQVDGEYCSEVDELNIRILRQQLKVAVPDRETDAAVAMASPAQNI